MEKLRIDLGTFEGDLKRLPNNMEEMSDFIYNLLKKHEFAIKHGFKEVKLFIIEEKEINYGK